MRPIVGYILDGSPLCPECALGAYQAGEIDVDPQAMRDLAIATDENGLPDALVSADSGHQVAVLLGYYGEDMAQSTKRCQDCDTPIVGF